MKRIILIFFTLSCIFLNAQDFGYKKIYQEVLSNSTGFSYNDIKEYAKSKNAYQFMNLGYFINANDIMYNKSKDIKYLNLNLEIINTVLLQKSKYSYDNKWLMNVSEKNQNSFINGKESLIFEGYFFRYAAEFLDIIKTNNLYRDKQNILLSSIQNAFNKWLDKSESKYKDASNLYHFGLHVAANWATTALYLYKYTNEMKYREFYSVFDQQLRNNLRDKKVNGHTCYVWNSTYSSKFTMALKQNKKYNQEIQDVTHANHVINYVIAANNINPSKWSKDDLVKFSNTAAEIIWKNNKFSDNVDGTVSNNKELINTGWKQSDGWMKLIPYNPKLELIYIDYYKNNISKVNKSTYALQFIANLY